MEASFTNMETMINDRMSYISQNVLNRSFSAPLLVPVCQSPCQGQQDSSLESPRIGYGNPEGRPEELEQAESAIPSFLSSRREAGIELPQGIHLLDKQCRLSSEDPAVSRGRGPHSASASGSEGSRAGLESTPIPRTIDPSWMNENVNVGASGSSATAPEPPLRSVSFAEANDHSADDAAYVTSEKPPPQEGLRAVLRLLYRYCPSTASEAQTHASRSYDFQCLFAQETQPCIEEPSPVLFHRVAELWAEAQQ